MAYKRNTKSIGIIVSPESKQIYDGENDYCQYPRMVKERKLKMIVIYHFLATMLTKVLQCL